MGIKEFTLGVSNLNIPIPQAPGIFFQDASGSMKNLAALTLLMGVLRRHWLRLQPTRHALPVLSTAGPSHLYSLFPTPHSLRFTLSDRPPKATSAPPDRPTRHAPMPATRTELLKYLDDLGIKTSTVAHKAVFTVDAPASVHPTFSPDSRQVVFHTPDLRVQVWDIAERRLQSARDVVAPGACVSSDLSPDGRFLACLDAGSNLALYDVNTSERVLERKEFFKRRIVVGASVGSAVTLNTGLNMEFSPDARFFVVGYHDEGVFRAGVSDVDEVIVYDLAAKAPIELNGTAKKLLAGGFSFTGPDRLLALNFEVPAKSAVVALPAGNVVRTLTLSRGRFDGATDGPFALYRPFQKYAVAIFDFDKGSFVKTGAYPAVDLYRDVFVAERSSGELALYALEGNRVLATTTLPSNTLGRLRTAVVSPDLKRLALSMPHRTARFAVRRDPQPLLTHRQPSGLGRNSGSAKNFCDFRATPTTSAHQECALRVLRSIGHTPPTACLRSCSCCFGADASPRPCSSRRCSPWSLSPPRRTRPPSPPRSRRPTVLR